MAKTDFTKKKLFHFDEISGLKSIFHFKIAFQNSFSEYYFFFSFLVSILGTYLRTENLFWKHKMAILKYIFSTSNRFLEFQFYSLNTQVKGTYFPGENKFEDPEQMIGAEL